MYLSFLICIKTDYWPVNSIRIRGAEPLASEGGDLAADKAYGICQNAAIKLSSIGISAFLAAVIRVLIVMPAFCSHSVCGELFYGALSRVRILLCLYG